MSGVAGAAGTLTRACLGLAAAALSAVLIHGAAEAAPPVTFADVTADAGIHFIQHNGAAGRHWYPEMFGGGVAVLDFDSDGRPDLLFVDGKGWSPGQPARHALYRNNGDGTFTEATAGSGFDRADVYGLGAVVADYDNDGRDDVFMTTVDGGRLFHNEGGRFVDVTERAGIGNHEFAVSAAWLDYDRDGLADLFVGNYVHWAPDLEVRCGLEGEVGYCGPDSYQAVAPRLYRNLGHGRFEDVTTRAGLDSPTDKAMGVTVVDYDGDGWPDLFVGNDCVPAKLYHNDGHGRFVDVAVPAGVAVSELGAARGSMGSDAVDYDRSGRPDLLVGNFVNEMLGLYHNENGRTFLDRAPRSAVGRSSLLSVTWSVFFADIDLDGWPDIFALNGGTDESQVRDARARLSQPPLLLRNRGDGTFENVSAELGPAFQQPLMGRGAAYLDFDGDGDLDLALTTLSGPARLLRNDRTNGHHWLRVRAVGSRSNRSGLGAVVRVSSASGRQWQSVHSGSSYASQSELTLTFGLGDDTRASQLELRWPSGTVQTFPDVAADQTITIDETRGIVSVPSTPPATGGAALRR